MPLYPPASTGGGGHVIEDGGTPLTTRSNMNFTGAGVVASDAGGKTVVTISGGGAGATTFGNTTIDFGAFPGSSHATAVITGQAGIVAGSTVMAWIRAEASANHTADEHAVESIEVRVGQIVAGTGFTIHARNTSEIFEDFGPPVHATSIFTASATTIGIKSANPGENSRVGGKGRGTRLSGVWNVSWAWA